MWKLIVLLFLSFPCLAAGTLKIATEANYPPFEYLDESGQFQGLDIDIANALCQQMKVQCEFLHKGFDRLLPGLQFNNFDAVIAALNPTPARRKLVAFSDLYYDSGAVFVARMNRYQSHHDFSGQSIGVQNGSVHLRYLIDKASMERVLVVPYHSYLTAFVDLQNDNVDLVLVDYAVAKVWLAQPDNKEFAIVGETLIDPHYFSEGYAIAVNKNNSALLEQLNQALQQIKLSGEYERIISRYLD
ncbi:transporter substrate-binding domain-containing protein [Motilimonas eburnea]|uniref:transporter substrate-binding domain-containing protein n=1 Tax=Motilimonas eburnea TaxID=1737488 RepID=UPI001E5245B4|nr:transporter substrate-binding domain-containing protein [Motilimonas eburnea]MCE2570737.1 transporter substrate-binding domain-containing protein [Motilimonas eburnea]